MNKAAGPKRRESVEERISMWWMRSVETIAVGSVYLFFVERANSASILRRQECAFALSYLVVCGVVEQHRSERNPDTVDHHGADCLR